MKRVLRNYLRDLWRTEHAEKRRGEQAALSVDAPPPGSDQDADSLSDRIPDESEATRPDIQAIQTELRAQIDCVRRKLTSRQQALVEGLRRGSSMSEISREMRVGRATLYDELARIRAVFEADGLDQFLD